MKLKRFISIALATVLASAVLSGCSLGGDKPKATTSTNKPMKFTMNTLDAQKSGRTEAFKYLTKKFNVEFEFIPVTFGDWGEKTRIWVAAGDMPDIMWTNLQPSSYKEFLGWIKQGVIRDIPALGNTYPNLQKLADTMKSDEYFKIDGKLYAWPSCAAVVGNAGIGNASMSYFYRKDWAEKLGLAKPNDEYTWDEFINLAKAFIEKDPGGNGPGKTIGLGATDWAFPSAMGILQSSPNWDSYLLKDGKYVWGMGEPETLTGIKIAKKLYDDGIIWKDHIIAKSQDTTNKLLSGQLGMYYNSWNVGSVKKLMDDFTKANPNIDAAKALSPMFVKRPDGKIGCQQNTDFWSATLFNKKMDDEKMTRIMQIYDWIASDEGWVYATKGVKGIDWDDKDGKLTIQPVDNNKSDHILDAVVRSTGAFTYEDPRVSQIAKDFIFSIITRFNKPDVDVRKFDLDLLYFSSPNKDKSGSLYEEGLSKIRQIVTSSKNVDKDWSDWLKSVEPKVAPGVDDLNNILLKQKNK